MRVPRGHFEVPIVPPIPIRVKGFEPVGCTRNQLQQFKVQFVVVLVPFISTLVKSGNITC